MRSIKNRIKRILWVWESATTVTKILICGIYFSLLLFLATSRLHAILPALFLLAGIFVYISRYKLFENKEQSRQQRRPAVMPMKRRIFVVFKSVLTFSILSAVIVLAFAAPGSGQGQEKANSNKSTMETKQPVKPNVWIQSEVSSAVKKNANSDASFTGTSSKQTSTLSTQSQTASEQEAASEIDTTRPWKTVISRESTANKRLGNQTNSEKHSVNTSQKNNLPEPNNKNTETSDNKKDTTNEETKNSEEKTNNTDFDKANGDQQDMDSDQSDITDSSKTDTTQGNTDKQNIDNDQSDTTDSNKTDTTQDNTDKQNDKTNNNSSEDAIDQELPLISPETLDNENPNEEHSISCQLLAQYAIASSTGIITKVQSFCPICKE